MFDLLPLNSIKPELGSNSLLPKTSNDVLLSEQVQSVPDIQRDKEDLTVFFSIGMTINIVMITSFFIWAVKQWRKNDEKNK